MLNFIDTLIKLHDDDDDDDDDGDTPGTKKGIVCWP